VRNHYDGKVGTAQRPRLGAPKSFKSSGADGDGRFPALRDLDAVVDTPRRTGASVARAGDHDITFSGEADGLRRLTICFTP